MAIETLQAVKFPLHHSRLIEASAGTGKTYTIAALYLRLVLNHGSAGENFGRPLQPNELLVVTFTEAATAATWGGSWPKMWPATASLPARACTCRRSRRCS